MDRIIVTTRCLNGIEYIDRFVKGYNFADQIIVSDGGSEDGSIEKWKKYYPKVRVYPFEQFEIIDGCKWNPDNPHIQHALDEAYKHDPLWVILDDLDCVPNLVLHNSARELLENSTKRQVNAFRLYMWGDKEYFPAMNRNFEPRMASLWAWKPNEIDIHADETLRHGTLMGLTDDYHAIMPPMCLLHKSWNPDTIEAKMRRYNTLGLPMTHPLSFAGNPEPLPEYAHE